jgi:hypothetical protein
MRRGILSMHVEFLLQQGIDGGVQTKGKPGGAADSQSTIKIEAASALLKELHLATAQGKERLLSGSVELGVLGRESHGKRVL